MEDRDTKIVNKLLETGGKLVDAKLIVSVGNDSHYLIPEGMKMTKLSNGLPNPIRKTGGRAFLAAKSFANFINKHKIEGETTITAYKKDLKIIGVINDHSGTNPGWKDFHAALKLKFSEKWVKWVNNSHDGGDDSDHDHDHDRHFKRRNKVFGQEEFAEFLENNRTDFMNGTFTDYAGMEQKTPNAMELSNIIANLVKTSTQKFTSKVDPISGKINLQYEDKEIGNCNVDIPREFILAIPVYENGDLFEVRIRLRHRIASGAARFFFIIDDYENILDEAFEKVCERITHGNADNDEEIEALEKIAFPAGKFKHLHKGTEIEVYRGEE